MRKINTGRVGSPILGNIAVFDGNNVRTLDPADTLNLSGNTVASSVNFDVTNGSSVRIYDDANFVDVNAPALAADVNFTLPANEGTTGYVLTTDGAGNLDWEEVAVSVTNETADNSTYYPVFTDTTSGTITDVSVSSTKLEYQPSSGTLTVDTLDATNGTFTDIEAGTITETSSRVLKTDVEPIYNAVDAISALEGVSYTRISSGRREAGLIAEEVEKVLPELVESSGKYKSISYSRLTAYLIEAVKSLKGELAEVKK